MEENKQKEIPKTVINERSIVYEKWEDFWIDNFSDNFENNIPVRFFWSGDEELEIALMSVHVARLEKKSIVECIINNVPREQFNKYVNEYKDFYIKNYDTHIVKTIEDY